MIKKVTCQRMVAGLKQPYFAHILFTLLMCGLLFSANTAFAQTSGSGSGTCGSIYSMFSPPCTDKSLQYISQIFGEVGGVVSGSTNTLFQQMFTIFNATVLGLGAMVIIYTLGVGVLKTAHEGESLGRQWSSIWIPIRSALGVAFLVPAKASGGYSFIQVLIMWIVVQGVGAADTLWNKIIDSLSEGTMVSTPVSLTTNTTFSTMLKNMVCMYTLDKLTNQNTSPTYTPQWSNNILTFPAGDYGTKCGSVTSLALPLPSNATAIPEVTALNAAAKNAVNAAVEALQPAAVALVYDVDLTSGTTGVFDNVPSGVLSQASLAYNDALKSVTQAAATNAAGLNQSAIQAAKDNGWIYAGSYYYEIASINDTLTKQIVPAPPTTPYSANYFVDSNNFSPPNAAQNAAEFTARMLLTSAYIKSAGTTGGDTAFVGQLTDVSAQSYGDDVIGPMWDTLNGGIEWFQQTFSGESDDGTQINPLFAMQSFGMVLLLIVEALWIVGAVILLGITVAGSIIGWAVLPGLVMFISFILWVLSFLAPVMIMIFVVGGVLAYYIPLMPYFLFAFGAIGWLTTVIEAMVAAPLVALGILHPEEHEVFGAAKPAIMIIVNVFLTPTLMLFGLMGAMALSYIVIDFVNTGFKYSMTQVDSTVASFSNITTFIALLIAYGAFVTTALQKCFSLIPELRNKALRWIGAHGEGFGEEQSANVIQGAIKEGQQTTGKMATEAEKGAYEGVKQYGQQKQQEQEDAAIKGAGGGAI